MMAMETVHLSKIEKASGPGRIIFRRNSTKKIDSGDSKGKVLSRYLRQSIGSCHDLCKYGTKEAFDVKESSPISKRVLRKSFDGQNIQQTGTDNSSVAKFRMSLAFKSQLCKELSVNQRCISTRSTNCQNQLKSVVLKNQTDTTKSTSGAFEGLRVKRETVKLKSTLRPVSACGSLKKSEQQLRAPLSPRSPLKEVASIGARHRTLRCDSYLENQQNLKQCASKEQNNDGVEEKTLYVIKIDDSGNKPKCPSAEYSSSFSESLPSQEDQEESDFEIDGPDDINCLANNATEDEYNRKTSSKRSMGEIGKDGSNCCDDKNSQSLKLMFSSCKAVDLHSDNDSPGQLRFRRGTILSQNTSLEADAELRSSKRDSGVDGDAVITSIVPEEVALKHQDVEDKKESKVMLNNVMEKTASELVKSQNSRVKALVGVFETIISLQGSKICHQHCQLRSRNGLFSPSW